ncbi:MAG: aminotransferase class III-fold pyridoxal phosphate-dependent enzyme [Mycobacterium sp.]
MPTAPVLVESNGLSASDEYFKHADTVIPTGVASMGRARRHRIAFAKASGAHLWDLDGNEYIDCVMGLGPIVLGHNEPGLVEALRRQVDEAIILGAETAQTASVADTLCEWIPAAERVVFANSGSEADQVALRIARATTGRRAVLKFEGHYHGWLDPMYTNTMGVTPSAEEAGPLSLIPNGPGQIDGTPSLYVTRWNSIADFDAVIDKHGDELAAVIMEPIPFNFGAFRAADGYLEHVRKTCTDRGIMLIFDEVVSGFRLGRGGAQELVDVRPDMTILAKALGGGVTISAVVGTAAAMEVLTSGRLKHGGTYNANPISIAGAAATLAGIENCPDLYHRLESSGAAVQAGLAEVAEKYSVPLQVNRVGGVLQLFWDAQGDRRSYGSCATSSREVITDICEKLIDDGVFVSPRGIIFMCYRHSAADIDRIVLAFDRAVSAL